MTFGDVVGPQTITVPISSRSPSFTLGNVSELTIDSAVGINAISVQSWIAPDHIRAPWLAALTSQGNFYPSLFLTGGLPPLSITGDTLGPVNIGGVIKGGAWSIDGSGDAIHVYATVAGWSASFQSNLYSINTVGSFRGVLTAGNGIGFIGSGKDLLAGRILAGAYLGDDGVFGGSGSSADTYRQGSISDIQITRNIAGTFIAAGLDPVDGTFSNGNDAFIGGYNSFIGRVIVGHIVGAKARLLANAYSSNAYETSPLITIGGLSTDWHGDQRFAIQTLGPSATLMSAMTSSAGGSTTATINLHIVANGLIDLDSITDGAITITAPDGSTMVGLLTSKSNDGNSNDGTAAYASFFVRLNNVGDPLVTGDYTIAVTPGKIADTRGHSSPQTDIGAFTV
jgi:hypothetical protein